MRVPGTCTECHRVRQVKVNGAGMARIAARQTPTGICSACEQAEEDLRRSEPMRNVINHVETDHEREIVHGTKVQQVQQIHHRMHQHDPRGEQYGHRHVGPRDNILRTRGR